VDQAHGRGRIDIHDHRFRFVASSTSESVLTCPRHIHAGVADFEGIGHKVFADLEYRYNTNRGLAGKITSGVSINPRQAAPKRKSCYQRAALRAPDKGNGYQLQNSA
jgi:hypothetical protein